MDLDGTRTHHNTLKGQSHRIGMTQNRNVCCGNVRLRPMVIKQYGSITAGLIVISGFAANHCVSRILVGFLWRSWSVHCLVFSFTLVTVGIHTSETKTTAACSMLAALPRTF